jgi:acetate kinase
VRSGRSVDEIEADLEHRSGLLGIGGSADMRELLAREEGGDARAALALEMFVRHAAAGIAAAATMLAAVDAIVFTGGIGEHADRVTSRVVERLHAVAGSATIEDQSGDRVSRFASGPAILQVAAREDLTIAGEIVAKLTGAA